MRDKLINKMADNICDISTEIPEVDYYSCLRQGRGQSMMDIAKILAEAALDALLGELKEVEFNPEETPVQQDLRLLHGSMLYQQILDLRK